ncbi:2-oxoadipate dioxygenase/decarboxylase family protein, partial [Chryseobacterium sp. SIMBA_029]|uniref:2-oxoadipate dioxygenase/decarboxylase family protein n=1 Tax=Chryseobacterium sp. SIMBA_029 TaxID=3085772 RepID=UPI00397D7C50
MAIPFPHQVKRISHNININGRSISHFQHQVTNPFRATHMTKHVTSSDIRSAFSAAMSAMYRNEVPAYGTLMDLVARVNAEALANEP